MIDAGHPALAGPAIANDGVDDFFEVWDLGPGYDPANPAKGLVARDCDAGTAGIQTSPRNIVLVVINNADVSDSQPAGVCTKGPECYMIRGFSRMYLEGCSHADSAPFPVVRTVAECEAQGGGGKHNVHGRLVEQLNNEQVAGELTFSFSGEFGVFLLD